MFKPARGADRLKDSSVSRRCSAAYNWRRRPPLLLLVRLVLSRLITLSAPPLVLAAELLTALIQMWWHAAARGTELRTDSPPPPLPFFPSSPSQQLFLCSCLFVYVIFHWEVSATAYYTPLTLIGSVGCADWALIAAFPFAFVPSSLTSWHPLLPLFPRIHKHKQQPGVHAPSACPVNIKHTARVGTDTATQVSGVDVNPDHSSISRRFHYLKPTKAESAAFP